MAQEPLQIKSVRIQNYRSIQDQEFSANRLNLFVGLNDVGKSNILRALDLFFNGASAASPYVFARDFCRHAKTLKLVGGEWQIGNGTEITARGST